MSELDRHFADEAPFGFADQSMWIGAQKLASRLTLEEGQDDKGYPMPEPVLEGMKGIQKAHRRKMPQRDVYLDALTAFEASEEYRTTFGVADEEDEEPRIIESVFERRREVITDLSSTLGPVFERVEPRAVSLLSAMLEGVVDKDSVKLGHPTEDILHALYMLERGEAYRHFEIPKKTDPRRMRPIDAPYDGLKKIQSGIYNKLLRFAFLHKMAFGFRERVGAVTGLRSMLNHFGDTPIRGAWAVDVNNFFGTVSAEMLHDPVHRLTKALLSQRSSGPNLSEEDSDQIADLIIELCTVADQEDPGRRFLIQGAPTSPTLSNMAVTPVDDVVMRSVQGLRKRLSKMHDGEDVKIWAGRYADDVVFFSSHPLPPSYKAVVRGLWDKHGLPLKPAKERGVDFVRNRQRAAFHTWGYSVKPAREKGEVNRFSVPGKQIRKLMGMLHAAVYNDDVSSKLLRHKNRESFSKDRLVGKIFGTLGYISYAYRNGGEWDPQYPVVPKKAHKAFVEFIEKYIHILSKGDEPMTGAERDTKYMGKATNPLVRRHQIPPKFGRLGRRFGRKEEPEDKTVVAPASASERPHLQIVR